LVLSRFSGKYQVNTHIQMYNSKLSKVQKRKRKGYERGGRDAGVPEDLKVVFKCRPDGIRVKVKKDTGKSRVGTRLSTGDGRDTVMDAVLCAGAGWKAGRGGIWDAKENRRLITSDSLSALRKVGVGLIETGGRKARQCIVGARSLTVWAAVTAAEVEEACRETEWRKSVKCLGRDCCKRMCR
jgi:hypothetical protein